MRTITAILLLSGLMIAKKPPLPLYDGTVQDIQISYHKGSFDSNCTVWTYKIAAGDMNYWAEQDTCGGGWSGLRDQMLTQMGQQIQFSLRSKFHETRNELGVLNGTHFWWFRLLKSGRE